jgi:SEC-C motif-containing protein
MKISVNSFCPCGSTKKFKKCCKIFHDGSNPKSALDLMKSRYSAYAANDYKYIIKTTHKKNKDFNNNFDEWKESILEFSKNCQFKKLEIIDFSDGLEESYVTFKATIFQGGLDVSFSEKSKFLKEEGVWLYHSGVFIDE